MTTLLDDSTLVSEPVSEEDELDEDEEEEEDVEEEDDDDEEESDDEEEADEFAEFEKCGAGFILAWLKSKYRESSNQEGSGDGRSQVSSKKGTSSANQSSSKKKGKKKKKPATKKKRVRFTIDSIDLDNCDMSNHYSVLCIPDEIAMKLNSDELAYAYKRVQQLCHPDKFSAQSKAEQSRAAERFKLLEQAFEVLSDDYAKKRFDSTLEWDDSVPSEFDLTSLGLIKDSSTLSADASALPISLTVLESGDPSLLPFIISDDPSKSSDYGYGKVSNGFGRINEERNQELIKCLINGMSKVSDEQGWQFYQYMHDYFERWSQFSKKTLPMLIPKKYQASVGDASKLEEYLNDTVQTESFYKKWDKFQSWRDFCHLCDPIDIYDLRGAENNSEKKWMKRQNDKRQEKFKLVEKEKFRRMLELCRKYDCRLVRKLVLKSYEHWKDHIERVQMAKQRDFEQKERMRIQRENEEKEKERQKREKRAKEREKEKISRDIRELPMKLRKLCIKNGNFNQRVRSEDIESIALHGSLDELRYIVNRGNEAGEDPSKQEEVCSEIEKRILPECLNRKSKKLRKLEEEREQKKRMEKQKYGKQEWTRPELEWLTHLCGRFPRGTNDRWSIIHRQFRKKFADSKRTQKELIVTAADLQKGKHIAIAPDRGSSSSSAAGSATSSKKKKKRKKKLSEFDVAFNEIREKYDESVSDERWSEHQSRLESALKTLMPQKQANGWSADLFWDKVSEELNGEKQAQECQARFKFVREVLLLKKKFPQ